MLVRPQSAILAPIDIESNILLRIIRSLNPEAVRDLMVLNHYFKKELKNPNYWQHETRRYFNKEYKKFETMASLDWFDIFKYEYHLHYHDLPVRNIKIFSALHSGDIAALENLALVFADLGCMDHKNERVMDYVASGQNQQLKNYFTQALVLPYFKEGDNYNLTRGVAEGESLLHYYARFNQLAPEAWLTSSLENMREMMHGSMRSPLVYAAQYGHVGVVDAWINVGFPIDYENNDSNLSALGTAIFADQLDSVRVLCAQGVKIDVKNAMELLSSAAQMGNDLVFNFLVEHMTEAGLQLDNVSSLFEPAIRGGNIKIANYIMARLETIPINQVLDEDNYTPLLVAADWGYADLFEALLARGADITAVCSQRNTVLHYAAISMSTAMIEVIVGTKMIDINVANNYGQTPLHCAAKTESYFSRAVIETLMQAGADIHATTLSDQDEFVDESGEETPLHIAAINNNFGAVEALLENGARVSAVNDRGETPLHLSMGIEDERIVKALISADADIHATDFNEDAPLASCLQEERVYLNHVERLVSEGAWVEAKSLPNVEASLYFSEIPMSEYVLEMLLNALPNVQMLHFINASITPYSQADTFYLEKNSLLNLERIYIGKTGDSVLSVLKMILKAAPNARLIPGRKLEDVLPQVYSICKEVFEETGHCGAGQVFAFACANGSISGIPRNLIYAKEIYTTLNMKKQADQVQKRIDQVTVSATGLFAPQQSNASTPEKRASESDDSSSKRLKK